MPVERGAGRRQAALSAWFMVSVLAGVGLGTAGVPLAALDATQQGLPTGNDAGKACADAYAASSFRPVTGKTPVAIGLSRRPAKQRLLLDPDFHTCVIRATDHAAEPPRGFARHDYARRQAFSADDRLLLVQDRPGAWHVYDANSLAYVKQLQGPQGNAEPQWHPTRPRMLYYLPDKGGLWIKSLDVDSNASLIVADFRSALPWPTAARASTRSEGSPSANGRYWCLLAQTSDFRTLGVFTYDLQQQRVIGSRALSRTPDNVSMSPSGHYCVIADDAKGGGTVAWDLEFRDSRQLNGDSQHSDLALGADGQDRYVFVDHGGSGDLVMVDLASGKRSALLPAWIEGTTTSLHVSGKAFERPGWVVVSTFNHNGREKWLHERVLAVELKAEPRIVNLARHHSHHNGYWTQPQASVNRDFTRIVFNSNWGATSAGDVDVYMIRLPADMLGKMPPR